MEKDMTKGSPTKLLLYFSIPLLIGNVFQQLYNMMDTIIVGRILGINALAAVGSTGSLSFLVLGFVWGLTGGFAVISAQKYGARDYDGLRRAVTTSIRLSLILSILLTALSVAITRPLLQLMNTPDDIIDDAYTYIIVIFAGIIATFAYNMISCILRALGDSKTPLYFLIVSSVLNIVLDIIFIVCFHLGVAGAAYATVISQAVAALLCFFYTAKKYPILRLTKKDWAFSKELTIKHLQLGLPMAFQFSITAIGTVVLQGALNLFGPAKIAAYTAACKVEQLVTQPASSFGVTMANYSGQNLGAGEYDRIRDGVKKCCYLTIAFAVGAAAIVLLFGEPLTRLFVSRDNAEMLTEVLSSAKQYLMIVAFPFPILHLIFVFRNALQGIGRSFMPLMAGVFELIVRVVAAFTLPQIIGFAGVCLAGPLAWVSACFPLWIAYAVIIKEKQYQMPDAT